MNPIATITMQNGKKIVIELLPDIAYNEVASFIWAAEHGYYDNHTIERIVPGSWIDMSYRAFGHEECKYFLPNRLRERDNLKTPALGDLCLGYYSDADISGTEYFFPLKTCDHLINNCPVIGRVLEGMDEILRIAAVPVRPVKYDPDLGVEINVPLEPEIISKVTIDAKGVTYPEPEKLPNITFPPSWGTITEVPATK
ncbi:MAG: peptidylprolyl isomerase [Clostridiaceae bacterium]|jgi:peptidyl-prolyl cis-trans isomerase B (cyclophilin B)|nr:peptidylprolyl isomerase [Clostridiaceae bacterium]